MTWNRSVKRFHQWNRFLQSVCVLPLIVYCIDISALICAEFKFWLKVPGWFCLKAPGWNWIDIWKPLTGVKDLSEKLTEHWDVSDCIITHVTLLSRWSMSQQSVVKIILEQLFPHCSFIVVLKIQLDILFKEKMLSLKIVLYIFL